ncbi:hypothetical protein Pelo_5746 [Pelomyxa schiedti]|nr:hypothetical protein Pelo_5746 [Pelomyxa schiedti]
MGNRPNANVRNVYNVDNLSLTRSPSCGTSHTPLFEAARRAGVPNTVNVVELCLSRAEASYLKYLTIEEAASISLYTYDFSNSAQHDKNPFRLLNQALFSQQEKELSTVADLLICLLSALRKLPKVHLPVLYRGITKRVTVGGLYSKGKTINWRTFSSTSTEETVSRKFLIDAAGKPDGTLFVIRGKSWGYNVQPFSLIPMEKEILLEPNVSFKVVNVVAGPPVVVELEMEDVELILSSAAPPLWPSEDIVDLEAISETSAERRRSPPLANGELPQPSRSDSTNSSGTTTNIPQPTRGETPDNQLKPAPPQPTRTSTPTATIPQPTRTSSPLTNSSNPPHSSSPMPQPTRAIPPSPSPSPSSPDHTPPSEVHATRTVPPLPAASSSPPPSSPEVHASRVVVSPHATPAPTPYPTRTVPGASEPQQPTPASPHATRVITPQPAAESPHAVRVITPPAPSAVDTQHCHASRVIPPASTPPIPSNSPPPTAEVHASRVVVIPQSHHSRNQEREVEENEAEGDSNTSAINEPNPVLVSPTKVDTFASAVERKDDLLSFLGAAVVVGASISGPGKKKTKHN